MSSTSRDLVRCVAPFSVAATLMSSLLVVACERAPAPGGRDSASVARADSAGVQSTPTTRAVSGWNADAGPFLVLPTVDGGLTAGSLLRPESTELTVGDTAGFGVELAGGEVELFARGGRVGTARLTVEGPPQAEPGCTAWPVARLSIDQGAPNVAWTAAFAKGRVLPIALDSIEGLSPRDSARMAIDLTRLASALSDDTVATFRGLPFVVLRAWRSKGLDTDFIVATLARRVNQEDAPREERLVLVVDQTGADSRRWVVAWHERASGSEEELVVAEPLLAFRTGRSGDVHLLFGRDDGVALGAAVLTRGAGGWRLQWESAIAGCN